MSAVRNCFTQCSKTLLRAESAMLKLVIGNQNYSTWSMRPWLFIAYHGLEVEIEKMSLTNLPLIRARFPHGKVPVLIDGCSEIWDSLAILEYLAELHPHARGWPANVKARACARSVCAEMHAGFSALRRELPMNCRKFFPDYKLSGQALNDASRIQQIWKMCRESNGAAGAWLFGDFSIADAMYAPVVMRFRSVEIELNPESREYCRTVLECKAVKQWLAESSGESEIVPEDELECPSIPWPDDGSKPSWMINSE